MNNRKNLEKGLYKTSDYGCKKSGKKAVSKLVRVIAKRKINKIQKSPINTIEV